MAVPVYQLSADRRLGCFLILAIMNKAVLTFMDKSFVLIFVSGPQSHFIAEEPGVQTWADVSQVTEMMGPGARAGNTGGAVCGWPVVFGHSVTKGPLGLPGEGAPGILGSENAVEGRTVRMTCSPVLASSHIPPPRARHEVLFPSGCRGLREDLYGTAFLKLTHFPRCISPTWRDDLCV